MSISYSSSYSNRLIYPYLNTILHKTHSYLDSVIFVTILIESPLVDIYTNKPDSGLVYSSVALNIDLTLLPFTTFQAESSLHVLS